MFDKYDAIIFDLDGTLIDSMWIWKAIDVDFLEKRGMELPDDLQKAIEGMSFTETAMYFKERFNLNDSLDEIKKEWNDSAYDYYKNRGLVIQECLLNLLLNIVKLKIILMF